MHLKVVVASALFSLASAAHLSLTGGNLGRFACGSGCLAELDCSQASVDAFSKCVADNCDAEDTSVAHGVERFMTMCHSFTNTEIDLHSLDNLKSLYVSSQMAIMKRQAAAAAANGTAGGNGTNGTNGSTSGGTGTGSGASTPTQKGTYATSCTGIADVLNNACIVRSSGADNLVRNGVLSVLGAALIGAFAL